MSRHNSTPPYSTDAAPPPQLPLHRRIPVSIFSIIALVNAWHFASGAEPEPSDSTASPIAYRRIFVPAEKLDAWPREGEKYLPVESLDFDQLIAAANRNAIQETSRAMIQQAEYSGRLEGGRLITGRGNWNIMLRGDKSAVLPLHPMSLLLREAHWRNDSTSRVRLGAWGERGSQPEKLGLEVPRSGILDFNWHTILRESQHRLETSWKLPAAMVTRLILDLPAGKQPVIDGGIILDSRPLPAGASRSPSPYHRWTLALSPTTSTVLRIVDGKSVPGAAVSTLSLRDNTVYHISERGVEIVADLHFDRSISEYRELSISLPADVRLLSAVADGNEIRWRVTANESSPTAEVLIELPELPARRSLTLTLQAWHPLITNQTWELPKLRVKEAFWAFGTSELSIAPMLDLQRIVPTECVQTDVSHEPTAQGSESFGFAAYSPDASLDVVIKHRAPEVTARLGSSLALTEHDLSGRLITRLDVTRGSLQTLSGQLTGGWIPESIETVPAEALGEWFVSRKDGRSTVEIQFARAAEPGRGVSVVLAGRLHLPGAADPITHDALRMVEWDGPQVTQHLLTFHAIEPYAAEQIGDLNVVDVDAMSDEDRSLLEQAAAHERVFDLKQAAGGVGLRVSIKRGRYDADICMDATCYDQQIDQAFHLLIRPRTSRIDRVLAYATQPLGDDVRWSEKSSGTAIAAERLPANDPRRTNLPADGEVWLLRLPHPAAKPIEIIATRSTARTSALQMPVLSLPEAVEQKGRVLVRGDADHLPEIEPIRMRTVPLPIDRVKSPGPDAPVRAAYRYEPVDCQVAGNLPGISFQPNKSNGTRSVIARRTELESFFLSNGRAFHRATYFLQNEGADQLNLRLPKGAQLVSMTLNAREFAIPTQQDSQDVVSIRLPSGIGGAVLAAYFETQQPPLRVGSELPPPLIEPGFPLLTGEWTIWLSEEFAATGAGIVGTNDDLNWRQRLFGPLGRPHGARPFHPLSRSDWIAIMKGLSNWASALVDSDRDAELLPIAVHEQTQQIDVEEVALNVTPADRKIEPVVGRRTSQAATLAGWHAYRTSFVARAPDAVVVAHPPATTSWGVAAFLFCIVLGNSLWPGRSRLVVLLVAAAAICCLWLPAIYSVIATGALLGLVVPLLVGWASFEDSEEPITKTWTRAPMRVLMGIWLLIGLGSASLAQSPSSETRHIAPKSDNGQTSRALTDAELSPPRIHRVLIPTGEDGRQSGTKYYVSEDFLRHLDRSADDQYFSSQQWVLINASYQGQLRERPNRDGAADSQWTMTFEVEVCARDTTIVLPLVHAEANWAETATLDGIPAAIAWNADEQTCSIKIAEPGRYQLAISCVPQTNEINGRNRIALTIPQVPGASLELEHPEEVAGLKVMGATITGEPELPGYLTAELDGSGRLIVEWPRVELSAGTSMGLRVTDLRWLRVTPTDVVVETKYFVEGGGRRPETLTIEFDDRWQLLPGNDAISDDLPASRPEHRQEIRVPLPPDDIDRQEVLLRWRLADSQVFGRMRLPSIELTSVPIAQRWLAVSSVPTLKCELTGDGGASSGMSNEFLSLWGDSAAVDESLAIYTNTDSERDWILAVQPRPTELDVDQITHVAAGEDGLRLQYVAQVVPNQEHEFQCRLDASPGLVIDEITMTQSGRRIPVRWAHESTGSVNVFFSQRAAENYRITVDGHVAHAKSGTYRLPRISVAADTTSGRVQLYREPGVLLEIRALSEYAELENNAVETPPAQWDALRAAAFQLDAKAFDVGRLVVTPNRLDTVGQTLTQLFQVKDGWSTAYTCQFTVKSGLLDDLRLRVPLSWEGPYDIQSDVPAKLDKLTADDDHAIVAVRFAESLTPGRAVTIVIRSPLSTEATSPLSVPQIAPETGSAWAHYLMVPLVTSGRTMEWTEVGVRPAELPKQLVPPELASASHQTFEVVARPFQVSLQQSVIARPEAMVRLADTICTLGTTGSRLIVTQFVVTSRGLTDCVLQLPADQQLVSVHADGSAALVRRLSRNEWRLPLGSAHLPQLLEIISRSQETSGRHSGRFELTRPTLVINGSQIPVAVSLWSLGHPLKSAQPGVNGAAIVPAMDQAALRLDRFVSISEAATPFAVESPTPDGYNWYHTWAAQLMTLRDESISTMAQFESEHAAAHVLTPPKEQLTRAAERLEAWIGRCNAIFAPPDVEREADDRNARGSSRAWRLAQGADNHWVHCVAEGGNPTLVVEMKPMTASRQRVQIGGLLAIVGLALAAISLMRVPAAADAFYRWPHAVTFLGGLAYWAWMRPSWLGLLISAASLLLVLTPGMVGKSIPVEGSTVLRRGTSD